MTTTSYVLVDLDTTPPHISIVGPGLVEPPADLILTVTSTEDMGYVDLRFTDSVGDQHDLGFERLDSRSLRVLIPTALIPTGQGHLRAAVADTVSNVGVATQTVMISAAKAFEVVLDFEKAMDVDEGLYRGYDVTLLMEREPPGA